MPDSDSLLLRTPGRCISWCLGGSNRQGTQGFQGKQNCLHCQVSTEYPVNIVVDAGGGRSWFFGRETWRPEVDAVVLTLEKTGGSIGGSGVVSTHQLTEMITWALLLYAVECGACMLMLFRSWWQWYLLQVLKLSGNEIGPSGGEAIVRAVSTKSCLQELDLNCMLYYCLWVQ